MRKYHKANRLVEKLILENTKKVVLDDNDPLIIYFAKISSKKHNIPERELARQYRRHSHMLRNAKRGMIQNSMRISEAAKSYHVSEKRFAAYLNQPS